jgi:ferrochelatase
MADAGVARALAFFTSAYSSYSGCRQYRENLADAVEQVGGSAPRFERIGTYWNHRGFLEPFVDSTLAALGGLDEGLRDRARLVFTTHSLPQRMADTSGPGGGAYLAQHREAAAWVSRQVAQATGVNRAFDVVFQSRSGSPGQPWLEPDVGEHLVGLHGDGVPAVVVVPIGFVSDHVEVLWDLDTQARQRADEVGLAYVRAATPGTDPRFVAMIRELVHERVSDLPVDQRARIAGTAAAPDRCVAGCCQNPRGPRPALCGEESPA